MFTAEWRTNNAYDTILILDDAAMYTGFAPADAQEMQDVLVSLGPLSDWSGNEGASEEAPDDFGALVMRRASDGTVLEMDADLCRARLAFWFH